MIQPSHSYFTSWTVSSEIGWQQSLTINQPLEHNDAINFLLLLTENRLGLLYIPMLDNNLLQNQYISETLFPAPLSTPTPQWSTFSPCSSQFSSKTCQLAGISCWSLSHFIHCCIFWFNVRPALISFWLIDRFIDRSIDIDSVLRSLQSFQRKESRSPWRPLSQLFIYPFARGRC